MWRVTPWGAIGGEVPVGGAQRVQHSGVSRPLRDTPSLEALLLSAEFVEVMLCCGMVWYVVGAWMLWLVDVTLLLCCLLCCPFIIYIRSTSKHPTPLLSLSYQPHHYSVLCILFLKGCTLPPKVNSVLPYHQSIYFALFQLISVNWTQSIPRSDRRDPSNPPFLALIHLSLPNQLSRAHQHLLPSFIRSSISLYFIVNKY